MKKITILISALLIFSSLHSQNIDCKWGDYSTYSGFNSESRFLNVKGTYDNHVIGVGDFEDVVLQGNSYSTGSNYNNGFVSKYDSIGNLIWMRNLQSSQYSQVSCAEVDLNNNIYAAGGFNDTVLYDGYTLSTHKPLSLYDAFLLKLDSDGHVLWSKTFTGTDSNSILPHKILLDVNGDLIVYLTNRDDYNFPVLIEGTTYSGSIILIKYDQSGNLQWVRPFSDLQLSNAVFANGDQLTVDQNNNIYFSGAIIDTATFNGLSYYPDTYTQIDTLNSPYDTLEFVSGNSFIASLTADGQERWMYTVKHEGETHYLSVVSDQGSNLFLTGYYGGQSGLNDTVYFSSTDYLIGADNYLLKLDTMGQVLAYRNIPTQISNSLLYGNNKLYIGGNNRYNDQIYVDTYSDELLSLDSISFGGSNYDYCWSTALTKSGTSMLIGGLINDQTNLGSCVLQGFNTCARAYIAQLGSDLITRVETERDVAQNLSIFPNPTNQNLSILVDERVANSTYQITDFQGRLVMYGRLHGAQTTLSISHLSKGPYVLKAGQERKIFVVE